MSNNKSKHQDQVTAATTPKRPERIRFGAQSPLTVPFELDEENFHYHFATESDVYGMKAAGYEYAKSPGSGENYVARGKGAPMFLMQLKQEYREEDLLSRRQDVINTMMLPDAGGVRPGEHGVDGEGSQRAIKVEPGGYDANSPYNK